MSHRSLEKRATQRVPLRLFVDHILGEQDRCLCVTENLSLDGLRLAGHPQQGWGRPQHVWLEFQLPDGKQRSIRALGELRYEGVTGGGMRSRGFRFKYMAPAAKRRYEAFLAADAV